MSPRVKVEVKKKVLEKNDLLADKVRRTLQKRGIASLNLISSPGSGKTMLLEKTLESLRGKVPCAVIAGDQETDNDARRLKGKGALVHQIRTQNTCHLDAGRVEDALDKVLKPETRLLFIENIGNLICPAAFDLGEDMKVALLSVTEGEDKPLKYPTVFSTAAVVILTKVDLAPYVEWNRKTALSNLKKIAPTARVFEVSAKEGQGMEKWITFLEEIARA